MTRQLTGLDRIGITENDVARYRARFNELVTIMPAERHDAYPEKKSLDFGDHFLDWEANLLGKVFGHFKEVDPDVCAMMWHLMYASEIEDCADFRFKRTRFLERRAQA